MIEKESWMRNVIEKMRERFGNRLLFAGLQGSYQREEAAEASDFDVVIVLEELTAADLKIYRSIIKTMPEHEKACGFVCGRTELLCWPKHEIFQLKQDTQGYFGSLDCLLPDFDEGDIRRGVKIAAADLYHAACHQYLFGGAEDRMRDLRLLYKAVFFILRLSEYLRDGRYCGSRTELLRYLSGEEKMLLEISVKWEEHTGGADFDADACFERLIAWCGAVLRNG